MKAQRRLKTPIEKTIIKFKSNMLSLKSKKSESGISMRIHKGEEALNHEIKEIFIGHRTIFSIVGFTLSNGTAGTSSCSFASSSMYGCGKISARDESH